MAVLAVSTACPALQVLIFQETFPFGMAMAYIIT